MVKKTILLTSYAGAFFHDRFALRNPLRRILSRNLKGSPILTVFTVLTLLCLVLFSGGCARTDSSAGKNTQQSDQQGPDQADTSSNILIQGPDTPPEGMRYDDWKGITYTDDTTFHLKSFFGILMDDGSSASANGVYADPEFIEDAVLTITDVKTQPVGGEMKLRSAGYVDITIEMEWTGTIRYVADNEYQAWLSHVLFLDNVPLPFDSCTGVSLLNDLADEESDDFSDEGMMVGQAVDSGFVESDVVWNGRTWRLFANKDTRNSGRTENPYSEIDGKTVVTYNAGIDTTLTLRVPADYDGMALAFRKNLSEDKPLAFKEPEGFRKVSDTYADILTTDFGEKKTADDFYFVRLSDLVKKFGK